MDFRASLILATVFTLACSSEANDNSGLSGSGASSAGVDASTGATSSASTSTSADASGTTSSGNMPGTTGEDTDAPAPTSGTGDSDSGSTSGEATTGTDTDGSSTGTSDSSGIEDGVLDIGIVAHNDCTFTVEPSTITVPEGTAFTVNWISSPASEVEFDIAKIDPFNQVPIVIGMEPGTAYHDDIREWCGNLFTGTFDFRLTSCFEPTYIPVDCGG